MARKINTEQLLGIGRCTRSGHTVRVSDVVVLNDFSGVQVEERTRSSGAKVTQLSIKAEPIAINFNAVMLGAAPAAALAKVIGAQIAGVQETTAPSTKLKRNYAEDAFQRGASWARRRYAGGRTGATPPNVDKSQRLFNDSGRLAAGIVAIPDKESGVWIIRGPANRLNRATFGSSDAFARFVERLVDRVEALRKPLAQAEVRDAIKRTLDAQVAVAKGQLASTKAQTDRIVSRLVLDGLKLLQRALG